MKWFGASLMLAAVVWAGYIFTLGDFTSDMKIASVAAIAIIVFGAGAWMCTAKR